MDSATVEIIGVGVTVGLAGAAVIGAVLKWSLNRNVEAMDKKFVELTKSVEKVEALATKIKDDVSAYKSQAVTDGECAACRKECKEGFVSWMARLDGKVDALLLRNSGGSQV